MVCFGRTRTGSWFGRSVGQATGTEGLGLLLEWRVGAIDESNMSKRSELKGRLRKQHEMG